MYIYIEISCSNFVDSDIYHPHKIVKLTLIGSILFVNPAEFHLLKNNNQCRKIHSFVPHSKPRPPRQLPIYGIFSPLAISNPPSLRGSLLPLFSQLHLCITSKFEYISNLLISITKFHSGTMEITEYSSFARTSSSVLLVPSFSRLFAGILSNSILSSFLAAFLGFVNAVYVWYITIPMYDFTN